MKSKGNRRKKIQINVEINKREVKIIKRSMKSRASSLKR